MTWQYIAGFFDGEGSFCHNGKGFRVTISQTDENVLNEIKKFTGIGNVIKVTKRQDHWKDAWVYYIAKQEDVLTFTQNIIEHLLVKKDLIIDAQKKLNRTVIEIQEKRDRHLWLVNQAKLLRNKGLTYRQIGKQMGIDFGNVRKMVLDIK